MSKASIVLGILALIVSILPLASGWFLIISWLVWIFGPLSIILGIIGLVKKQSNSLIGIILSICAVIMPLVFAEKYIENSVETAGDAINGVMELTDTENFGNFN